ncbi:MAG: hypothetical protein M3406_02695 [Chloroflexota bacterium]|nr:hypothetical protein [Chloroflexota bacterium]
MTRNPAEIGAYRRLPEPELLFDLADPTKRHAHPLHGLLQHGPLSQSAMTLLSPQIRLAPITPHQELAPLSGLIDELRRQHRPKERRPYLPDYPGMTRLFGREATIAGPPARVELPADLDARLAGSEKPHIVLAEALGHAIAQLEACRPDWDVVAIYLPARWSAGFKGSDDDFDLHDYVKAVAAVRAIPSQIVTEEKALAYYDRASVAWRLSIALYTKAGGVPWKMVSQEPETAFMGLSYALRGDATGGPRFVTCCSQVFDAEGAGLEFVAFDTERDRVTVVNDNPFLTREQMRAVVASSLALYVDRQAGRTPRRVVLHKQTEFRRDELDGIFDALPSVPDIEAAQILEHPNWRGVLLNRSRLPTEGNPSDPDRYPVHRGTTLILDERDMLLWTHGNSAAVTGGQGYLQGGKGIPRPIIVRRFAGRGAPSLLASEILGLTKMDWNNDALYDMLPATLGFASTLAHIIKRMPTIDRRTYPFRLFM